MAMHYVLEVSIQILDFLFVRFCHISIHVSENEIAPSKLFALCNKYLIGTVSMLINVLKCSHQEQKHGCLPEFIKYNLCKPDTDATGSEICESGLK